MKRRFTLSAIVLSTMLALPIHSTQIPSGVDLQIEPLWQELDSSTKLDDEQSHSKWMLVAKITLKKRTQDKIELDHLNLAWNGSRLEYLLGSLYELHYNKPFLPIEQYLVCDSAWQAHNQKLQFSFDKMKSLPSETQWYVVLFIPADLENTIHTGSFEVERSTLPSKLQDALQQESLSIAFGKQPTTQTVAFHARA